VPGFSGAAAGNCQQQQQGAELQKLATGERFHAVKNKENEGLGENFKRGGDESPQDGMLKPRDYALR
jgi:hypothetical protein